MANVSRSFGTLAAGLIWLGCACGVSAQTTSTAEQAVLHFTFRDSARGTAVCPDAVLIDDKMVYNIIDEAGRMTVPVAPGDHRVVIKADGYDDMDSRQTASVDHAAMNLILLDPENQPEELQPENLGTDMPADGTVIAGYVTDETTGKPIQGAKVELTGRDLTVLSDARGYFKLPVSMPDGKRMPDDTRGVLYAPRDFQVTKPGYGFEERINVLLESGTPRIYQVQLVRGGGGNSIDEAGDRNNLQSGLFGLTNVEPEDIPTTGTVPSPN